MSPAPDPKVLPVRRVRPPVELASLFPLARSTSPLAPEDPLLEEVSDKDPELPRELPPDAIKMLPPADIPLESPPRAENDPPGPYRADPPDMRTSPPVPSIPVESPASTEMDPPDEPLPTASDNEPERPPAELPVETSMGPVPLAAPSPVLIETLPDNEADDDDFIITSPDFTTLLTPDDNIKSPPREE